jgi:hypothetical protein
VAPAVIPPLPADSGSDHITVTARNLRLQQRESAALTSAKDAIGDRARITVRSYRTNQVITQYFVALDTKGNAQSISFTAKSNGITLDRQKLVEIETAVATTAGKWLYYTEARSADASISLEVPFLLYGADPRIAWPALGSSVQVNGYLSSLPLTKDRAIDKESFDTNSKGEYSISVEVTDASSGALLGSTTVSTKPGQGRDRSVSFGKALGLPEGATVKYTLSAKAKNGKVWTATGSAQIWTLAPVYPQGWKPVTISVLDDYAASAAPGQTKKD